MATTKVYLNVPFSEKDEAKHLGAKYDGESRLWYCPNNLSLKIFSERWDVFLNCPYSQKDDAKAKGARFDAEKKLWYINAGESLSEFRKWLPYENLQDHSDSSPLPLSSQTRHESHKANQLQTNRQEVQVNVQIGALSTIPAVLPNMATEKVTAELTKMKSEIKEGCSYNIVELKELLKSRGVKGISNLSKQELIDRCISLKLLCPVLVPTVSSEISVPSKKRKTADNISSSVTPARPVAVMTSEPADFICPISMELMTDPVICADGFSYERSEIEHWLRQHSTSPKTNEVLGDKKLIPNKTLKAAIITWKENRSSH